ncbi:MAG: hypothetical protein HWN68_15780 [Desulfobacterales bacterium]|nr:hypothetical protein [Desulfobacterales bacterium]
METVAVRYCFTSPDGSQETFDLQLDAHNLDLLGSLPEKLPPWTNLDCNQCPNCPLTIHTHPHCPLAARLVNIVERFNRFLSYDQIHVDVITEERFISHDTTVQIGISSLMGLVIATCGCPHTAFLKPMARFHLPLSTEEETTYRAASMYLLAQYFLKKEGLNADLELEGLRKIYRNIHLVNTAVAERLRTATETDSSLNAISMLDMYALTIPLVIDESLEEIRHLFSPFLTRSNGL